MRISGVRTAEVHQLTTHLVGVVRQRFNLLARHDRAEGDVAIGRGGLAIPFDGDRRRHPVERQHEDLTIAAAADADVRQRACLEAGELGLDRVAARNEVGERRLPLGARRLRRDERRFVGRVDAGKRHPRARQDAARLVDDRHLQAGVGGSLGDQGGGRQCAQADHQDNAL